MVDGQKGNTIFTASPRNPDDQLLKKTKTNKTKKTIGPIKEVLA